MKKKLPSITEIAATHQDGLMGTAVVVLVI